MRKKLSIITDITIFFLLLIGLLFYIDSSNLEVEHNLYSPEVSIEDKSYIEATYLEEKFDVDIVYGKETAEYAEDVNAEVQEDQDIIYNNIMDIESVLNDYPEDFFRNGNIKIILLKKFNNDNIALAATNNINVYNVYISNDSEFKRALNHELFHIFEYKLNDERVFANWQDYNPKDFKYVNDLDLLDSNYVYYDKSSINSSYFATVYSKTDAAEDRAEIFSIMMTFKERPYYLAVDSYIRRKADRLVKELNTRYKKDNIELNWERY